MQARSLVQGSPRRAYTSGSSVSRRLGLAALRSEQPAGSFTLATTTSHITNSQESRKTFCKMAGGDERYHPQDAVGAAITGTLVTGTAGAFMSAVQNALARQNIGAMSVFTRTGGVIAVFGMVDVFRREESKLTVVQRPWEEPMSSPSSHPPTLERRTTALTLPLVASSPAHYSD